MTTLAFVSAPATLPTSAASPVPGVSAAATREDSRARRWTGWVLTGLLVAFLVFDALMKVLYVDEVAKASSAMGMARAEVVGIGVVLLACTLLYTFARTALLGAVLLTGYFGGAMAVHVALHTGAFSIAFAGAFGVITWLALSLRDTRVSLRHLVWR